MLSAMTRHFFFASFLLVLVATLAPGCLDGGGCEGTCEIRCSGDSLPGSCGIFGDSVCCAPSYGSGVRYGYGPDSNGDEDAGDGGEGSDASDAFDGAWPDPWPDEEDSGATDDGGEAEEDGGAPPR